MGKRKLANGIEIIDINKHETDFLYNEIFVENTYHKPEFKINPNGIVLDVGANIGLFALYITDLIKGINVKCFEPSPVCADVLRQNTEQFRSQIEVLEVAAGDQNTTCEFFHYPGYTIMSSLMADEQEDRATLIAGTKAQAIKRGIDMSERELELLTDTILGKREIYTCSMRTISSIIKEQDIARISLLKIDVEKAEHKVLSGIDEEDLKRVDNVIIEVHDLGNKEQNQVRNVLNNSGFNVNMVAEGHLESSEIYTVWGWRN